MISGYLEVLSSFHPGLGNGSEVIDTVKYARIETLCKTIVLAGCAQVYLHL